MAATPLEPTRFVASPGAPTSRARWAGRVMSGIIVLLLALDTAVKLAGAKQAVAGTTQLGFPAHHVLTIGLIELVCLVLYVIPRTAPLGAALLTGYLGGAVATHLRLEDPLFTHILSPVYVAVLLWGGLYLRDARVRAALGPSR
jgi:hypothetical protein